MFCVYCGKKLREGHILCLNCGSNLKQRLLKCSKCDYQGTDGDKFCLQCGTALEAGLNTERTDYTFYLPGPATAEQKTVANDFFVPEEDVTLHKIIDDTESAGIKHRHTAYDEAATAKEIPKSAKVIAVCTALALLIGVVGFIAVNSFEPEHLDAIMAVMPFGREPEQNPDESSSSEITQDEYSEYEQPEPVPPPLLTNLTDVYLPLWAWDMQTTITTAAGHSAAITAEGELWAWGNNENGQLGVGTHNQHPAPVWIIGNVISVHAADDRTMAIDADGGLWAWGNNENGRLGNGTTTNHQSPVWIMGNVAIVTTVEASTFAITNDGSLWAWGANENGQLGDGTTTDHHSPVRISDDGLADMPSNSYETGAAGHSDLYYIEGSRVAAVAYNAQRTLALTDDGVLWVREASYKEDFVRFMENVMLPLSAS